MPRCLLLILVIFADRPADATLRSLQEPQDRHDIGLVSEFGLGEPGRFSNSVPRAEQHIVCRLLLEKKKGRKNVSSQTNRLKHIHPRTMVIHSPHELLEVLI